MKQEHRFPCEKCGAKLKFSAEDGELKCSHCGHLNAIERSFENIVENDYDKAMQKLKNYSTKPLEVQSVKCSSCAASFEIDSGVHSSVCPYCSSAIVKETQLYKPLKPEGILPFKLTKKDARDAFREWLKALWFAPNKLKEYGANDTKLDGIYIPHWTYDSDTYSRYSGRRGDYYYVKRKDPDTGTETKVRKTRWSSASGSLDRSFDDILVMASSSMKHTLSNWDLQNLVDYDEAFLSGYESEIYSVELDDGLHRAKDTMELSIRSDIKMQIGGDEQEINSLSCEYNNITFKQILLPIYASAFKFNSKIYSYVINARTGEISGDRPYSSVKIALAVVAGLLVAGTGYYFFGQQ